MSLHHERNVVYLVHLVFYRCSVKQCNLFIDDRKQAILSCQRSKYESCLVSTCWLTNHILSIIIRRHVNTAVAEDGEKADGSARHFTGQNLCFHCRGPKGCWREQESVHRENCCFHCCSRSRVTTAPPHTMTRAEDIALGSWPLAWRRLTTPE